MDNDHGAKTGVERDTNGFLRDFFVFWIVHGVASEAAPLLTSKRGREARHVRKYVAEVSRSWRSRKPSWFRLPRALAKSCPNIRRISSWRPRPRVRPNASGSSTKW